MNAKQIKILTLAMAYLESFIECEQSNYELCPDCGTRYTATDIVDFREASKALDLLSELKVKEL